MGQHNLWKTTEIIPLLKTRGVHLSPSQAHRLVTQPPERIPARTFAALCDVLECTPNDLFQPRVEVDTTTVSPAQPGPELRKPGTETVVHRVQVDRRSTS